MLQCPPSMASASACHSLLKNTARCPPVICRTVAKSAASADSTKMPAPPAANSWSNTLGGSVLSNAGPASCCGCETCAFKVAPAGRQTIMSIGTRRPL